ncbi:nitrate reductase [Pimelobacter simplex]|uniref:Uracil permease n=1 Tax=Nocardioides simplex TaxID=2045 RepID=A0A0A1DVI7_NOCSI|nr:solute carrier family 23 protein [Pimelobacter simplex]AIY19455.1 Uracil permease [Pimelobacter simplex]MCG8149630.1 nitrate reductase [Pimelobacter simplex]GEB16006.1 nitrate reductase [Pimelobacter simplex]SFM82330.1 uracil-xanthine permease [Pimelobacter simplex]
MALLSWSLHGDGKKVIPGRVVTPDERLAWPRMAGLGAQHVIAMFSATTLVPVLTGFPVSTTLFFSGVGTLLFLVITRNKVPSYTGSAFAFIAPVLAAQAQGGYAAALCGLVATGVALIITGLIINQVGYQIIDRVAPPVVTGTIVTMVGLNLAPVAWTNYQDDGLLASVTLAVVVLVSVLLRGFISRLAVFIGVAVGYLLAAGLGRVELDPVRDASWLGWPDFTAPTFSLQAILLIVPAVLLVLVVENAAHVKAVSAMCERNLDSSIGNAVIGDGVATTVSGMFGGSGQITYAENIGVMALTRIYSTAAYMIAAGIAIALSICPKFGALVGAVPLGVLGGVSTILFGMIACMGLRMYVAAEVDFRDPVNLTTAALGLIVGAANYTLTLGDYVFAGIALSGVGTIVVYHLLRFAADRAEPGDPGQHAATPASPALDVPKEF